MAGATLDYLFTLATTPKYYFSKNLAEDARIYYLCIIN
jgi:hypothetical protein